MFNLPAAIKPKKIIFGLIILFWLFMTLSLLLRQFPAGSETAAYKPFLSKNRLLSDQWMGIYFNGKPVGFLHSSIEPYLIKKGVSGFHITSRTWMNFLLLRKRNRVWFNADAVVDDDYRLKNFSFDFSSGAHEMKVKGDVLGDVIALKINSAGNTSQRNIKLPKEKGVVLASILSPFQSFGALKSGEHYHVKVFNPFTLEIEPVEINVGEKGPVEIDGKEQEAFLVKTEYRGMEQAAWVDEEGAILKEETGIGWTMIREDMSVATKLYKNMSKSDAELAEMVSLTSNIDLPREDVDYLKIALFGVPDGFDLESQRQKIVASEPDKKIIEIKRDSFSPREAITLPCGDFSEFRQATVFVQSDDARIKDKAEQIVSGEKNSLLAAEKINTWVFEHLAKTPVLSVPSAVDVLKTREGDCNEHTVLFVALARAAGIPAKINVGLAYSSGRFYYHAWPSVYTGKWLDMDPTFGETFADAAHIKLLEGDLNKQLDIVRLLGKIKLEVIEYK